MLNLLRSIIPNPWARALFLKGVRWASAAAAGALIPLLVHHGLSTADATEISGGVATVILGIGSALGSYLDAKAVQTNVASTAQAVATAPPATQAAIASQASAALAQGDGASKQLDAALTALKAGAA